MKRLLTAAVAVPLVVLITVFAPDWLFAFAVGLVSALAVEEFLSLGKKKGIGRPGRWFLVPAGMVAVSFIGGAGWVLTALALTTIALMTATIFGESVDSGLGGVGIGLSSVVYCPGTLGFLVMMPRRVILLLFVIIWVGDTFAYYGGRALGRHLLAPKVSPKKTVEGAVA